MRNVKPECLDLAWLHGNDGGDPISRGFMAYRECVLPAHVVYFLDCATYHLPQTLQLIGRENVPYGIPVEIEKKAREHVAARWRNPIHLSMVIGDCHYMRVRLREPEEEEEDEEEEEEGEGEGEEEEDATEEEEEEAEKREEPIATSQEPSQDNKIVLVQHIDLHTTFALKRGRKVVGVFIDSWCSIGALDETFAQPKVATATKVPASNVPHYPTSHDGKYQVSLHHFWKKRRSLASRSTIKFCGRMQTLPFPKEQKALS